MYVTLGGGLAAAILDPIFIFGFGLGLDGAAISTVLARVVMFAIGIHGAHARARLVRLPDWARLRKPSRPFFSIGFPAVLTQIATPVGNAYVTDRDGRLRRPGRGRLGDHRAHRAGRLRRDLRPVGRGRARFSARISARANTTASITTMRDSLTVTIVYVAVVWALLAIFAGPIASLFGAEGLSRELIMFFCHFAAGSFLFNGALFVASAAFNNLGYPTYSTLFNWGRSTLGVIPFVWAGAYAVRREGRDGRLGTWRGGVRHRCR